MIISLFVDVFASFLDDMPIDQHLYIPLIPLFIDQCNTPRIINVVIYLLLFPASSNSMIPEYVSKSVIGFFVIFNIFIGPRKFRCCKKVKSIIKIEKLE